MHGRLLGQQNVPTRRQSSSTYSAWRQCGLPVLALVLAGCNAGVIEEQEFGLIKFCGERCVPRLLFAPSCYHPLLPSRYHHVRPKKAVSDALPDIEPMCAAAVIKLKNALSLFALGPNSAVWHSFAEVLPVLDVAQRLSSE